MSTVITPFQGTDPFSTATFNNRISQINTGFSYVSNPNLLDNWYFGNAVNQRGATGSITINRYFIDRWLYANGDSASSLIFNDGVVTLNGNNGYCALRQIFETPKSVFIGRSMTISVLTTNMGLVSYTFTCLDGVENFKNFSDTGSYIVFDTRADNALFTFVANKETISVIACKVEFGDQQTLAHQENGVWVLNEIPDYGEQLARCQRYFYKVHYVQYQTINAAFEGPEYSFLALPIPVCMRVEEPVLTQSAPIIAGVNTKTFNSAKVKGSIAILGVNYGAITPYANANYAYCPTADGVTFTLSADL